MRAALLLLALITLPAGAQDSYVGASLGHSNQGGYCQDFHSLDGRTTCTGMAVVRLFGGHHFTPNFIIEGAVHAFEWNGSGGLELAAVGVAPLDEHFALYGRLGVYSAEQQNAVTLAAGLRITFNERIGMRLEWQSFHASSSIDVLSIGVFFPF